MIKAIKRMTGWKLDWRYMEARKGYHICYISDPGKFISHYPNWKITCSLDTVLEEISASQRVHQPHSAANERK